MFSCTSSPPQISTASKQDQDSQINDTTQDTILPDNSNDTATEAQTDADSGTTNNNKNCKLDKDCGSGRICVMGKCADGCKSNNDCKGVPGTQCNTALGRCLNVGASMGACSAQKCSTGCCYATKGFTELKCLKTATYSVCGFYPQGQILLGGTKCIPSVCSKSNDLCPSFNSSESDSKCYECKEGELICSHNTTDCNTGTGSGIVVNALSCIPAGEMCTQGGKTCCSGQPCIQGYCY